MNVPLLRQVNHDVSSFFSLGHFDKIGRSVKSINLLIMIKLPLMCVAFLVSND